jgi:hypothetical protein
MGMEAPTFPIHEVRRGGLAWMNPRRGAGAAHNGERQDTKQQLRPGKGGRE